MLVDVRRALGIRAVNPRAAEGAAAPSLARREAASALANGRGRPRVPRGGASQPRRPIDGPGPHTASWLPPKKIGATRTPRARDEPPRSTWPAASCAARLRVSPLRRRLHGARTPVPRRTCTRARRSPAPSRSPLAPVWMTPSSALTASPRRAAAGLGQCAAPGLPGRTIVPAGRTRSPPETASDPRARAPGDRVTDGCFQSVVTMSPPRLFRGTAFEAPGFRLPCPRDVTRRHAGRTARGARLTTASRASSTRPRSVRRMHERGGVAPTLRARRWNIASITSGICGVVRSSLS